MNALKRNPLIVIGAGLLVIILLWYFLLYSPQNDDLSSAQAQTATEQKKTDALQADLARLQSQAKNSTQAAALLRKLDAAVPEQPDLAEFIIQANDIADQSGISFLSISPSPPTAGTGASVINLTISIQGSFFQLEDYLRLLEQLERLVIVDGITISASNADSTSTGSSGTTLGVTLTGRMFTRAAPVDSTGTGSTTPGTTTPGGSTSTTTPGATTSPSTTPTSTPTAGGT